MTVPEMTQDEDSSPLEPARLLQLYSKPRLFFERTHDLDRSPEIFLVIWLVGMNTSLGRVESKLGTSNFLIDGIAHSWGWLWVYLAVAGAISGFFGWYIGGWWYGLRLEWAGARDPDPESSRELWAFVSLTYSLPGLLLLLYGLIRYDSYADWHAGAGILDLIPLIALFWSPIVSHSAATTRFDLDPGKARLWFLILPYAVYLIALAIGVVALTSWGS